MTLARILAELRHTSPAVKSIITAGADGRYVLAEHVARHGVDAPTAYRLEVCRAVLRAARRIDALNAAFLAEGRPILPTRFGLHAGEAMVGSVGTADRSNYTVLGHTVNVASRVEQLNKLCGTRLLATATVRQAAGNAIRFRHLGVAEVRGTRGSIDVYELRADAADPHADRTAK